MRTATLTEEGVSKCERLLGLGNLYDPANMEIIHHVYQGLRAHTLFERDVDYVVKDGEVVIVDEFTGRQMPGRRWSDGLHQAVEAKEGVKIERENQTLATITFQNYFRMYKKLSGMTGTAETEAPEFRQDLQARSGRDSHEQDADPRRKFRRRLPHRSRKIRSGGERHHPGRRHAKPAASGSITKAASPCWSAASPSKNRKRSPSMLKKRRHSAPGAERQAARARSESHRAGRAQRRGHRLDEHGRPRNRHFAGRQSGSDDARVLPEEQAGHALRAGGRGDRRGAPGTETPAQADAANRGRQLPADAVASQWRGAAAMVLFQQEGKIFQVPLDQWKPLYDQFAEQCKAEHDEVVAMGGLHILGTERHEARRIDNQLRGRAGRQGDPGSSRFFLSLEDDLLRIFGGERVKALMYRAGNDGRRADRIAS